MPRKHNFSWRVVGARGEVLMYGSRAEMIEFLEECKRTRWLGVSLERLAADGKTWEEQQP